MSKKVVVIGLDCTAPFMAFDKFKGIMPNLSKLIDNGISAEMRSVIPPITCPAWMCMMTSKDPGTLGVYGFRHRKDNSYTRIRIANSDSILNHDKVWNVLNKHGKKTIMLGVPQTYTPKPVDGLMVTSFLTPSIESEYTYPPELKEEIADVVGEYILDAAFRVPEKKQILEKIYEMTDKRFNLAEHFIKNKTWDFFMMVEMGTDRMHHAFWRYFDETHRLYDPNGEFNGEMEKYYEYLDKKIGSLLDLLDEDTSVIVVSDHGAKKAEGCFCINEWLIKEGYLKLNEYPKEKTKLEKADVDWANTKIWGWGGYYARIFFNRKSREEFGLLDDKEFEETKKEFTEKIKNLKDHEGNPLPALVVEPEKAYKETNGDKPDLMVFFGDLAWRSGGTIGHNTLHLLENDTGPDDAMHDWNGIFVLYDPKNKDTQFVNEISILDVAPTILDIMNIEIPDDMQGKKIKEYLK